MTYYKPNMTLEEILEIEGIIIRKIPTQSVSRFKCHRKHAWISKDNKTYSVEECGLHNIVTETRTNTLGGKYLVTLQHNQDSTVRFSKGRDGIGDTVVEAWRDLVLNGVVVLPV